jgi:hypothetical protein
MGLGKVVLRLVVRLVKGLGKAKSTATLGGYRMAWVRRG